MAPHSWPLGGGDVASTVSRTGRPVRIDDYHGVPGRIAAFVRDELGIASTVGSPIDVEGRLWGALFVHSKHAHERLPRDTESRLTGFTELVATAIANAESRAGLARLAEEQAALRRVATLVAGGAAPEEVFAAVAKEVGGLLGTKFAGMARFETDDTVTVLAAWDDRGAALSPVPGSWPLAGGDLASTIARTGRPVRIDDYHGVPGRIAAFVRDELGVVSSVGSPIVVEGRLWGALFVHAKQTDAGVPPDAEPRLTAFTELVATAIANADSRTELAASRVRIVAAADETRRRIERDLHDGAQQRLVALGLGLRAAQAAVPPDLGDLEGELSRLAEGLVSVQDELREMARGIHPAILAEGGLGPALKTLARRCAIPVELDVRAKARLPERVEVAAYYVVSEALTNAAKHANAAVVQVEAEVVDGVLHLCVRDDGAGGADPTRGSGLVGLKDRVETLGGTIIVQSRLGAGTSLQVELPVSD